MYWMYDPIQTDLESKEAFQDRFSSTLERAINKAQIYTLCYIKSMRRPYGFSESNDLYPPERQNLSEDVAPGFEPSTLKSLLILQYNIVINALNDFLEKTPGHGSRMAAIQIEQIIFEYQMHKINVQKSFLNNHQALEAYEKGAEASWEKMTAAVIEKEFMTLPLDLKALSVSVSDFVYNTSEFYDAMIYNRFDQKKMLKAAQDSLNKAEAESPFTRIRESRLAAITPASTENRTACTHDW